MAMLTPISITNADKTVANRDIIKLIDLTVNDMENEVSIEINRCTDGVPDSMHRKLAAMIDRRNLLARQFGIRERN